MRKTKAIVKGINGASKHQSQKPQIPQYVDCHTITSLTKIQCVTKHKSGKIAKEKNYEKNEKRFCHSSISFNCLSSVKISEIHIVSLKSFLVQHP